MKKLLLVLFGFPFLCMTFLVSVMILVNSERVEVADVNSSDFVYSVQTSPQYYAALPHVLGVMSAGIDKKDARTDIVKNFLIEHESPFSDFSPTIIEQSDKYNIDFRIITAIAMCESNVGKKMPEGSYNAWGYKIYTGKSSGAEFGGWEEAIQIIAKYISDKYYNKGLTTPLEMGPIYAPPSVKTGNSWANCVEKFMDELT